MIPNFLRDREKDIAETESKPRPKNDELRPISNFDTLITCERAVAIFCSSEDHSTELSISVVW